MAQRVDDVFSEANLADRASYGRFLCPQAAAHVPVERALDAGGVEELVIDWPVRRRAQLIREDLLALNLDMPPLEPEPILSGVAAMLGAAYVLEGSRLGGAVLRRSVPDSFPTAFLSGGTATAWRDLILLLDTRLVTQNDADAAIVAVAVLAPVEGVSETFNATLRVVDGSLIVELETVTEAAKAGG